MSQRRKVVPGPPLRSGKTFKERFFAWEKTLPCSSSSSSSEEEEPVHFSPDILKKLPNIRNETRAVQKAVANALGKK